MTKQKFTIGADPEVFIGTAVGMPTSAIGLLGGSKAEPVKFWDHGYVQEDNILAEFNIDPCSSAQQFIDYIQSSLSNLDKLVKSKNRNLRVIQGSAFEFSNEQLRRWGPKALEFGCDPDVLVHSGEVRPALNSDTTLRSAGGHIHVGVPGLSEEAKLWLARGLDMAYSGAAISANIALRSYGAPRLRLYGADHTFRYKEYGVEYRYPCNHWIFKQSRVEWIYRMVDSVVNNLSIVPYFWTNGGSGAYVSHIGLSRYRG